MKQNIWLAVSIYCLSIIAACSKSDNSKKPVVTPPPVQADTTFTNPLLSSGPDPWVLQEGGYYYYTNTSGNKIIIRKTQYMDDLKDAPAITVWTPPTDPTSPYNADIWAPEIHYLNNKWYIYFAADNNGDNAKHRIYVLENSSNDPMNSANWVFKGQLAATTDKWAIDATVFMYKDTLYATWSGWPGDIDGEQDIYIAKMSDPYTISGDRIMISKPIYGWEDNSININEGPEALINANGQLFVTYSANACWSDDYCLGLLTLKSNGNPMNPNDWTKSASPVFTKNTSGGAFGPGHNGFFLSPDGKENWIIYHANSLSGQGCGDQRNPRIQKFSWNNDGTPNFGIPAPINKALIKPSGK